MHLAASLSGDEGAPLAGQELAFEIAGTIHQAVTDGSGIARLDVSLPDHGKSQTVTVRFGGDDRLGASQTTATITWGKKSRDGS